MLRLTDEQDKAKDFILDFLFNDKPFTVLQGFAGTGKTTIINRVIDEYLKLAKLQKLIQPEFTTYRFCFTAMTNKAKNVLQQTTPMTVKTLHSFLGIRPNFTYSDFQTQNTVVIVDECSYIDSQLFFEIEKTVKRSQNLKYIFMGDKYQLPPVGLKLSPVFEQGFPTVELTQSVRQINAPYIAKVCEQFRQAIDTGELMGFDCKDGIHWLERKDFKKQFIQSFNKDTNSKFLALTNNKAQQYNTLCFKHYNGRKEFAVGDRVVNNEYYHGIPTDSELTIKNITPLDNGTLYSFYETLTTMRVDDSDASGDIRADFASTIYKAQGSTYDDVYIDLHNLSRLYKHDTVATARALYVAFSRAKNNVYLTGDIV